MPHPDTIQALEQQRARLRDQLASIGDLRPGSLVGRYRRCGKPGCHCAQAGAVGHGPSWSLTRAVRGKTVTQVIPAGPAVARSQAQLAEYRRFRQLIQAFLDVSTRLCDAQLQADTAAPADGEKRGSPRPSRPRSSRKSRRSPA
jgi:hypothetical protein